jgi:hypothetical protein
MHALDRWLNAGRPVAVLVAVVALFVAAWIVSRVAKRIAVWLVDRGERRRRKSPDTFDTAAIGSMRQRETAIDLISTTVRYVAFALAGVFSLVAVSGAQRLQTVVGASFIAVILGFAVQRFLTDIVAGLLMFFEGWFRIGDTVAVDPWRAQGVVEAVSLRSLTLRTISGEVVHIPNSQVLSLRVIPRGYRDVEVEFFVSDLERGRELLQEIGLVVPIGPTRFLRRPELLDSETLAPDLHRITARCAVAAGREWLAEDFLPTIIRERAAGGLLAHGPVVTFVDERALRSFARATGSRPAASRHRAPPS